MSYLIQILLPTSLSERSRTTIERVKHELTDYFGGVTMHIDAPAEGLWKEGGLVDEDRIVVAEVMVDSLDTSWWAGYRKRLESLFEQKELVIRSFEIDRL